MKKIFPHIFVGISFLILLAMGTWQLNRLAWKEEMITKIDGRINGAPIALADYKNIEDDEFKPMTLTGKFNHKKEIILLNKPFNGKAGYHVVTPLTTNDGETVIVNRGWVPSDKEPLRTEDEQTITGIIRATQKLNFIGRQIMIPNTPDKNQWFWVDLPVMYKTIGAPEKNFYLEMTTEEKKPKFYPYPLPKGIKLYNEHLQYAITWYSLAIALLVIYYFRFFRNRSKQL